MAMRAKPTPKVYATRPACKWHGYKCDRPVAEGDGLCALHLVSARTQNRINNAEKPGYSGPLTEDDLDRMARALAADLGCDCAECLRAAEMQQW